MSRKSRSTSRQLSAHATHVAIITIQRHFGELRDRRVLGRSRYPLMTLVILALLASICGADGWDQIEAFIEEREDWLRQFLDLPEDELPSDDTFRRVLGAVDPVVFRRCLLAWLTDIVSIPPQAHIAIDGKTVRRSFDRAAKLSPMHVVEAWVVNGHVLLGQVATDAKSNEIPAVAELLEQFKLDGTIVTMDAMGTQRAHTEKISARGGDYILAVKDNQPSLRASIEQHVDKRVDAGHVRTIEATETSHGRTTTRTVRVAAAPAALRKSDDWTNIQSVIRVDRASNRPEGFAFEQQLYITSLPVREAERIAQTIRAHWGIENTLHWTLDVTMREDESRVRQRTAAENLAIIRRVTLSLLKNDTARKGSLRIKRMRASMTPAYALQVLFAPRTQHETT
jgi:predicted transposase YbfD/YdcC